MSDVPVLTDGSVVLRAHREDDVERVLEQCRDPLSVRWTTVPSPYTMDDAKRFVRHAMPGGWATDQEWGFAVEVDGRFGGSVNLRDHGEGRAELGYGAHPDVRGTGVMERACRLLLEWGFAKRDVKAVSWWANRGNFASRKLAWRLGFEIQPTPFRGWLPHRGELVDGWRGVLVHSDRRTPRHPWYDAPVLLGTGIRLRPVLDDDLDAIVEACNDERTSGWIGSIPVPLTRDMATDNLLSLREEMAEGRHVSWAVSDPGSDSLVGRINLMDVDRTLGCAEIGYWTHPSARGRGIATEAVRIVVAHAFAPVADGGLGLDRLYASVAVGNEGSRHVLTSAGFLEYGVAQAAVLVRSGPSAAHQLELLTDPPGPTR